MRRHWHNSFGVRARYRYALLIRGAAYSQHGWGTKAAVQMQSTYALKAIVVALSSFKDLLFLDSDSFALYNPAVFFEHKRYAATGAILWQDFWDADWAPDAPAVLGIDPDAMPAYTLESGQMVLDKGRRVALPAELHAVAWPAGALC